jgi:hypothetical protein
MLCEALRVRAPALATSKIEQSGVYLITDESAELCGMTEVVSSTCTAADAGALRCAPTGPVMLNFVN